MSAARAASAGGLDVMNVAGTDLEFWRAWRAMSASERAICATYLALDVAKIDALAAKWKRADDLIAENGARNA